MNDKKVGSALIHSACCTTFTCIYVPHGITIVCLQLPTVGASVYRFNFVQWPCNVFHMIVWP